MNGKEGATGLERLASARNGDRLEWLELDDCWLVDPWGGRQGRARLAVERGHITTLDWQGERDEQTTDSTALLVLPGLTDLHAHFREPGREHAETIASGMRAAAHGGFTRVAVMANTEPPVDRGDRIRDVLNVASEAGAAVTLLPYGTITEGRAGTSLAPLAELASAGAAGFSDDGSPVADASLLRDALESAGAIGRPVVEHPEAQALTAGAEAHDGVTATMLGLRGAPAAAEVTAVARSLELLADVARDAPRGSQPRLHLTHLSCAESIELVRRAKATGSPVTCDVTPHHLAMHEAWVAGDRRYAWEARANTLPHASAAPFDASTRVNPPLRGVDDAAALAGGIADGTVDAIATDHAPHGFVEKAVEYGDAATGISGIETALGLVLETVDAGILRLESAIRALTLGPDRVLGVSRNESGSAFGIGSPADLVIVDRDEYWPVTESALLSRGKNTPLLGRRLPGRVLLTVAAGRVAYLDAALR